MIRSAKKQGFTLVELLVVILIIGLLAGLLATALVKTQNSAKEARTRGTITKLNNLIMDRWNTYQTRRVPLAITNDTNIKSVAAKKLNGLRELMRLELPDHIPDFMTGQTVINSLPSVTKTYQRAYNNKKIGAKHPMDDREYESAECLFLIVAYGLAEEDAISQFSEDEIGDFDGDGLKEFKDGWDQPIAFLRWAPKLDSPVINTDTAKHHDPFDTMNNNANAYALYPLIYSAGNDKLYGIETGKDVNDKSKPNRSPLNDPYSGTVGNKSNTEDHLDNITNHELLTAN